jgi:Kef-type K+ transport system membrane component KefB
MLRAVSYLGLVAFMFIAGLEVDPTGILRQGRTTLITSIFGIILRFALGSGVVVLLPELWSISSGDWMIFSLFMGTALSISALPVIARILIDLDLLKEELGGIIMGAATINDIAGWSIFALILSSLSTRISLSLNLSLTVGVLFVTACILYLAERDGSRLSSAIFGSIVDLTAAAMLVAAIASEMIGIHGIVGSFLAGVILSERRARRDLILRKTYLPVMLVLAPIFHIDRAEDQLCSQLRPFDSSAGLRRGLHWKDSGCRPGSDGLGN